MPGSGIKIVGQAEFQQKLKRWSADVAHAMSAGATEWGERTMAISKGGGEGYGGNIVPVDTGVLMSTGHVQAPEVSGHKIIVTLGYGGPAADYAAAVHEGTDARNWSRPGSGTDYLRGPVEFMGRKVSGIVGRHVKEKLK